jgi:hypothetical protein
MESNMSKVVIEMTMSLDGFVSGPEDGEANPLGKHGGMHIFDWYFSCTEEYRDPRFRPEPGSNREEVERLFADSGTFIFGGGVRLFDEPQTGTRLEKLAVKDGPYATHLRYRVAKSQ